MTRDRELPVRLVSVLGPTSDIDVAVAATAPVRDLLPELARALGADVGMVWELVVVESQRGNSVRPGGVVAPFRLDDDCSLADAGVVDGDRLHLVRA